MKTHNDRRHALSPAEPALEIRKFLLNRVMQRKLFPNESDDDEDAEEEVEASVCYSESAT